MLISRNLILQGFLKSGSKSCKPEVTFAIHHQPLSPESKVPLLSVFRAKHADFRSYVCLRDYMQRLPEEEKWLAGTLSSGYTLEEIPVLFCCEKEELAQIHNRLQRSMMEYLKI